MQIPGRSVIVLELLQFKEDKTKEDQHQEEEFFFIEIKQEDETVFWSQKSFSFYEILEMGKV